MYDVDGQNLVSDSGQILLDSDSKEVDNILLSEVIPPANFQVNTSSGNWADVPYLKHDHVYSKYDSAYYDSLDEITVKVTLSESYQPAVFVSKVRLTLTSSKQLSTIAYYSIHLTPSEKEILPESEYDGGFWLFIPPKLLKEFCINFRLIKSQRIDELLKKIEVLKPPSFGKRITHVVHDSEDNLANQDEAVAECRKNKSWLSATGSAGSWIGLLSVEGTPRLDDGGYSGLNPMTLNHGVCHGFSNDKAECSKVSCSATEVEYFTVKYSWNQTLVDICREGRGIPVLPSSDLEVELVLQAFPDQEFIVATCDDTAKVWEDVIPERECDLYDCSSGATVILTSEGSLINGDDGDGDASMSKDMIETDEGSRTNRRVLCKRLPEVNKQYTIDRVDTNGDNRNILFDNDLNDELISADNHKVFHFKIPAFKETEEVRIFTKYSLDNENTYVFLKVTIMCSLGSETRKQLISLSSSKSNKFHRIVNFTEPMVCSDKQGASKFLIIEWPKLVAVTEVQVIKKASRLSIAMANEVGLKTGSSIEITCTVIGGTSSSHSEVTWICTGGQECSKNELILEHMTIDPGSKSLSWISVRRVRETGMYTCQSGESEVSLNVPLARSCDTGDLGEYKYDAGIIHDASVNIGERVRVKCEEGYNQVGRITCKEGGVFVENLVDGGLCIGQMGQTLSDIRDSLSSPGDMEEASNRLFDNIKQLSFISVTEVTTAIELLEAISEQSSENVGVLSTIFRTACVILKKEVNGIPPTITQIGAYLGVIDFIGRHSTGSLKLESDGLALISEDIGAVENDLTFVMYNDTTIDNLKLYRWPVEMSQSANAISLPSSYCKGRVWYTVYEKNTFLTNHVASYILGANIKNSISNTDLLPPFIANVTLRKLYYGAPNSAECVFWDKESEAWSRDGVKKIQETDTHVICQTSHLTSFTVLMTRDDSFIPNIHNHVLNFLSMFGCAVSSVSLLFTIIGLLRFSEIRNSSESIVHVNFSISLLAALLVFLTMIDKTKQPVVCLAVAISLHYLFLVAIFWMFCEALNVYLNSKSVLTSNKHVVLMMVFAWMFPLLIVGFTILTSDDLFEGYVSENACWLKESAMIYWFAAPVTLIAIINIILYILILKQYIRNVRLRTQNTVSGLRNCLLLLIVFGCTWVLGFFTLFTKTTMFQYLFAMTNSLQGVCIFYCYCASDPRVIVAWKSGGKAAELLKEKEATVGSNVSGSVKDETPAKRKPTPTRKRMPPAAIGMKSPAPKTPEPDTILTPVFYGRGRVSTPCDNWYENDDECF